MIAKNMYKLLLTWAAFAMQTWAVAQNVEKYHDLVNKAELFITEYNEKAALELYQEAFRENFGHFSKDYYNALLCAIKMKADSQCVEYTRQLIMRGVPPFFFNQPHLQYVGSIDNLTLLYETTKTKVNKSLQDTISLMIREDQQYRGDNIAKQELIAKIDELNYVRIVRILKEYGYPSELLTGISIMGNGKRIATRNDFDILLTHQLKNGHCELVEYLKHSLRNGLLNPEVFVTHATYCLEEGSGFGCFNRNQEVYFQVDSLIFTCDTIVEAEINQTRKQYYLSTINDLKKKVSFSFNKLKKQAYSLHCNYSVTYRELNGNDLTQNIQDLKKKNPGIILFKTLESNEPYFW
jgi:hypothetical protein